MKYIQTYEQLNIDLRASLYKLLKRISPSDIHIDYYTNNRFDKDIGKNDSALVLRTFDIRKNISYREDINALVINISQVNDKQLRKERNKPKMKISVIPYDIKNSSEKEFITNLTEFIVKTLKTYSYFNKTKITHMNNKLSINDYYINTSDVENILRDLEELDLWLTTKKYNL